MLQGVELLQPQSKVSLSLRITYQALLLQVNRVDAASSKGGEGGEEAEPLRGREDNKEGSRRGSLEDLQRSTSPTMLLSVASDHEGYDTRYAKSFIHLTREALPRLDNYRNIMSIQAAYRPTLDELHNATLHGKVGACFLVIVNFWDYAQWPIKKSICLVGLNTILCRVPQFKTVFGMKLSAVLSSLSFTRAFSPLKQNFVLFHIMICISLHVSVITAIFICGLSYMR
jgi:hypothetical protein